jgi:diguanylate cyclase (GGDEF)-like protein/PAS domain S-box-containing protein
VTADSGSLHNGLPLPAAHEAEGSRARDFTGLVAIAAAVLCLVVAGAASAEGVSTAIWSHLQLTAGAIGSVVICWTSLRFAPSRSDADFRRIVLWASITWAVVQLTWVVDIVQPGMLPPYAAIAPAGLMIGLVWRCWSLVIRDRFSPIETAAVYLDSSAVALIAGAAVLLSFGPAAAQEVTEPGVLLYAVIFGATISGFVVLYLAVTPIRTRGGALAALAGLLLLAGGLLARSGMTSASWSAVDLVTAGGMVVAAYGCATWTLGPDPSPAFRAVAARIRSALPLVAVAAAPAILVANELAPSDNSAPLALGVDLMVAAILILSVVRQTLLLRERGRMVETVTRAVDTERSLVAELQASERRFRRLVQNSSDVVMVISVDGEVLYQSPAVQRVLGYEVTEEPGQFIFDWTHPEDAAFVKGVLRELAATTDAMRTIELRIRHADGSWRTIEAAGKNMIDDPDVRGIVVNYRDVTDQKALEQQLVHDAFHDPLTGLANRALFTDRVEHGLQRRGGTDRLSVLFMDVDDFKTINDSLGHAAGDQVLVAIADRLRACLRPEDTVSRLGGDEFAVLVESTTDGLAGQLADRILRAFREPFGVGDKQVQLLASIGIAHAGIHSDDAADLLRNADVAMYTAKGNGKGRAAEFESSMHVAALTRLETKADLEQALTRNQLSLRYQPVFNLKTGQLAGFEALLRWQHPIRGEIGPAQFIPIAEETGLIVPIGEMVIGRALEQAVSWMRSAGRGLTIGVNISARQLREATFVGFLRRALEETGLPPEHLMMEITETSLMQDDEGRLGELRSLGIRLALDDFGTGYSSLSYLSRFPISHLKIDRSFIGALGVGDDESALVRSVVELARAMNMKTVAEGIERPEQLSRMMAMGCDFAQGYLLARPMDAAAAGALLTSGATLDSVTDEAEWAVPA